MPQTNIYAPFKTVGSNVVTLANADATSTLLTGAGSSVSFNITAPTVVKASPGRVAKVSVIVAGSTAGTINDVLTTGAAGVANQLATIPETVGLYDIDMPTSRGIVVVPGTGMTVAVSYI